MIPLRSILCSLLLFYFQSYSSLGSLQAMEVREFKDLPLEGSKSTHSALLHQAAEELQGFVESQDAYCCDRIYYYQHALRELQAFQKSQQCTQIPKEHISFLNAYYQRNLIINQTNKNLISGYQNKIEAYFHSEVAFPPIGKVPVMFREFMRMNGFNEQIHAYNRAHVSVAFEFRKLVNPTVQQLDNIYSKVFTEYGLQEIREDFSRVRYLAQLFYDYLQNRASFLISRHYHRGAGEVIPSSKIEDWPELDEFDREQVEVSCNNFGSFITPLCIIYKALQKASGDQSPLYLFEEECQHLLSASKTLLPLLQNQENIDLDPDSCLSDVREFEELKLPIVAQTLKELNIKSDTLEGPSDSKSLSRSERRLRERNAKKLHQKETKSIAKVAPQPVKEEKSISPTSQSTKKRSKAVRVERKRSSSQQYIPEMLVPSSSQSQSPSLTTECTLKAPPLEQSTPLMRVKPKRWRGDVVVRNKSLNKTTAVQLARKVNNTIAEITHSKKAEESPSLYQTECIQLASLTKEDLEIIDLLCNKKTHPGTITRKNILHLFQSLNIEVVPTTGSIYTLHFVHPEGRHMTRVMHLWKELGRNMMKRAYHILQEFGVLAEK